MNTSYIEVILLIANIEYLTGELFAAISQKIEELYKNYNPMTEIYQVTKRDIEDICTFHRVSQNVLSTTLERLESLLQNFEAAPSLENTSTNNHQSKRNESAFLCYNSSLDFGHANSSVNRVAKVLNDMLYCYFLLPSHNK